MTPTSDVLEKLRGVTKQGDGWAAFCPAHEDTKGKSLTVTEAEDERVLLHCFKGCTFLAILEALGLEQADAFPKPLKDGKRRRFSVRDQTGRVVAVHHRDDSSPKKRVWWTTPEGKTGLGGLKGDSLPLWGSEAIGSVSTATPIVVCEGEKAAFALTYRGIPAVGTVTGASGTPGDESLRVLANHPVTLWPDNDSEGLEHMRRIGKQLSRMGLRVRMYEWPDAPEKGDAADHPAILRNSVEGIEALRDTLANAPRFKPPHDPATDGAATFAYAEDAYAEIRALRRKSGGITGIKTGIPKLDNHVHGLNKGYSYIIAARPNVGKSLLAGQIALTAAERNYRVLLQTPEMSAVQYLDRFACRLANVDYFKAQEGRTSEQEEQSLSSAANLISALPLLVDDYGGQSTNRVRDNIERHEPDLVVVDYLQYLQPDEALARSNRNQQVGQISRDLARLKSDYQLPILVAAQLNRATEHRAEGEPILADLRDSGELEQDADVVLMLHRPDMNNPDVDPADERVRLLCRKNRMGQLWHTTLGFVPGQQWLTDETYANGVVTYA